MRALIIVAVILVLSGFLAGQNVPWLPLWPSLAALILVVWLRQPVLALATGAACGALLLNGGRPDEALWALSGKYTVGIIASPWNTGILLFTILFGGFAGIVQWGGGLRVLADRMMRGTSGSARRLEGCAMLMGIVCFFDGLINALLVGRLFAPLTRQHGFSRVRLAYIVDSTSSPIACLAVASTWIAYQLSMIQEGLGEMATRGDTNLSPYGLFLASWPYNFYGLFTLVLLAVSIRWQWSIGPMRGWNDHPVQDDHQQLAMQSAPEIPECPQPRASAAVLSLGVLLTGMLGLLWWDGMRRKPPTAGWLEAISYADASATLVMVAILAGLVAYALHRRPEVPSNASNLNRSFMDGAARMLAPLGILIAAWALSATMKDLGTSRLLAEALGGTLPPLWFPSLVFLAGAGISFMTGTSWGTMGILTPLALPVALSYDPTGGSIVLPATLGAIFSGAVFGDHCSPLSDTTIMSATACGVDPWDHVRTQLPHALIAGGVALLGGFLPSSLGANPWLCIAGCSLLILALPKLFPMPLSAPH